MKVSILGWYGHGNLGDEAMLEGIQYLTEKQFGSCDFTVMNDATFTLEKANESDLFILGGGELINRDRLFLNAVAWDYNIIVPKLVMGCGLNNPDYVSLQDHVKRSLRRFQFIGVRDGESYKLLREDPQLKDNVCLSLDPSLILPLKYGITWNPMEGVAAVVPTDRKTNKYDLGILATGIIDQTKQQLLDQLKRDNVHLAILLAFGGDDNDDYASCEQLAEHFKPHLSVRIVKPTSPKEALEILSACGKVYTYRLHGLVLAYALGIPFCGFGYHRKVKRNRDTLITLRNQDALWLIGKAWEQFAAN
jgi:polysaccharide pyruvyl transferase WcaK-like protein